MLNLFLAATMPDPTAELHRIAQELRSSADRGDPSVFARYMADNAVYVTENNDRWGKERVLADLQPPQPGIVPVSRVEEFHIAETGGVVVATYLNERQVSYHGQPISFRSRLTDTWLRTPGGWRLLAEHVSPVLRDPPTSPLSATQLADYAGTYRLAEGEEETIRVEGDHLVASRGWRPGLRYVAELRDLFLIPGAPRTRRVFLRDAVGRVTGFADRREGEDVIWRRLP